MDPSLSDSVSTVSKRTPFAYDAFVAKSKGFCVCESSTEYRPRNPEDNPLYGVVSRHLETYLARQRERERPVPRFVERELRAFLDCGVPARGFLRVHCDVCGKDRIVPFSCKGRSICSSCCGRRMADTAAHLVDRVLPMVPIRQWVLSLPISLGLRLRSGEGCYSYTHSDGLLLAAAAREETVRHSKSQMWKCNVCAAFWRCDQSEHAFPLRDP